MIGSQIAKLASTFTRLALSPSFIGSRRIAPVCQAGISSALLTPSNRRNVTTLVQDVEVPVDTITHVPWHMGEKSLMYKYMRGKPPKKINKNALDGNPFLKGVVLRNLIKKPKKPNSARRKCVHVRLSNGREVTAYVPGVGHNLQEHNIVLVRAGRLQDVPGVKHKVVRGWFDCAHVKKGGRLL